MIAAAMIVPVAAQADVLLRDASDAAGPLDIRKLSAEQSGRVLSLSVKTRDGAPLGSLSRKPRIDRSGQTRHLCIRLGRDPVRLICFSATDAGGPGAFAGRVTSGGRATRLERVRDLRVRRDGDVIRVRGKLSAFKLRPGRTRVAVLSDWTGAVCIVEAQDPYEEPELRCRDRAPDRGTVPLRVIRPRVVGCTRDEHRRVTHGSRRRSRVALTFDDGPGPYTDDVLRVLRGRDVRATFFVVGQAVSANPGLVRRELRQGHELGNHSTYHRANPSYGDIRTTSRRIRSVSGFKPCVFRPPYGALSGATAGAAWDLGMSSILWDVDPQDWRTPGSAAIAQRVISRTRDGSIILLHDAGGDRRQTVAALPSIIDSLRRRGFRFVTVTKLLRERLIWKP